MRTINLLSSKYVRTIAASLLPLLDKTSIADTQLATLKQHGERTGETITLLLPLQLNYQEAAQLCKNLGGTLACHSTPEQADARQHALIRQPVRPVAGAPTG